MNLSYFVLISRLFAIALFVATASKAFPAVLTVTNLADSGPGTLRQSILQAVAGDTIQFSITGTITLTNGELVIATNLTLSGPGAGFLTVQGQRGAAINHRVFNVTGGMVIMSGLTVAEGFLTDTCPSSPENYGPGIMNSGTLTLNNVTLTGNMNSSGYGGAIHNSGTLVLNDCVLANNISWRSCYNTISGAGVYNSGTLWITNTLFVGNEGTTGGGLLNNTNAFAYIWNSSFTSNSSISGVGIWNAGTLRVKHTSFSDNRAWPQGSGSGIFNRGTADVDDSTFSNNESDNGPGIQNEGILSVRNSGFYGNRGIIVVGFVSLKVVWELSATVSS